VPASSPAVGSPAGTTTLEADAAGLLARGVLLPVCLSKDTAELAQATQLSLADADAPPSGSSRSRSSSSGGPPCDAGTLIALSRDRPGLVQVKFSRLRPFFSRAGSCYRCTPLVWVESVLGFRFVGGCMHL
jgi:hypothetical protein